MARKLTAVANGLATAPVSRKVISEDGRAISWHPDGHKQGHVTVYIDLDSLIAELGRRAIKSKAGKAQLASGDIVVKVTPGSITRHPPK
jgi:hypothetical protein